MVCSGGWPMLFNADEAARLADISGSAKAFIPRLRREIERFEKSGGNWEKLRCSAHSIKKTSKKAIPEGFLGKAHAHRFRHSFGSNLIRADVNVKVVQTLMRHESIQMTLDIYGHILDVDADDAIAKAFP